MISLKSEIMECAETEGFLVLNRVMFVAYYCVGKDTLKITFEQR